MGASVDRLLALTETDSERDASAAGARFRAIRRGLLVAIAAEQWHLLPAHESPGAVALHTLLAALTTLAAAMGWSERWGRISLALAAGIVGLDLVLAFPNHANHHYLIFLCATIVAVAEPGCAEEERLALGGLRWLLVIGISWAGVQKLLYGYYFGGEFIAYMAAERAPAADLFALLIPPDELARLRALEPVEGAGPYRVESLPFVLASNVSVLGELLLAPALLVRRLRPIALVGMAALFFAIELGARELFFGLLVAQLLLLFAEGPWLERALPWLLVGYAALLATMLGLLPHWEFT